MKRLPLSHLPGHVEQKAPVGFAHAREQSPEFLREADSFARAAPRHLGRPLPLRKIQRQRTLLPFVEELLERDPKHPRKLFEGVDRWHRVAVFYARDVGGL